MRGPVSWAMALALALAVVGWAASAAADGVPINLLVLTTLAAPTFESPSEVDFLDAVHRMQTVRIAVDVVNNSPDLLPHNTLNVTFVHDLGLPAATAAAIYNAHQGATADAIMTLSNTADVVQAAGVAATAVGLPLFAPAHNSAVLDPNRLLPAMIRMAPASDEEGAVLARMVNHLGWSKVAVVYSLDGASDVQLSAERFLQEADDLDIDYGQPVLFSARTSFRSDEAALAHYKEVLAAVQATGVRVIVIFAHPSESGYLLEAGAALNILPVEGAAPLDEPYVVLGSTSWYNPSGFQVCTDCSVAMAAAQGSLGLASVSNFPDLQWVNHVFAPSWPDDPEDCAYGGFSRDTLVAHLDRQQANVYDSVLLFAKAVTSMCERDEFVASEPPAQVEVAAEAQCMNLTVPYTRNSSVSRATSGASLASRQCYERVTATPQLLEEIRATNLTASEALSGHAFALTNGERPALYEVHNYAVAPASGGSNPPPTPITTADCPLEPGGGCAGDAVPDATTGNCPVTSPGGDMTAGGNATSPGSDGPPDAGVYDCSANPDGSCPAPPDMTIEPDPDSGLCPRTPEGDCPEPPPAEGSGTGDGTGSEPPAGGNDDGGTSGGTDEYPCPENADGTCYGPAEPVNGYCPASPQGDCSPPPSGDGSGSGSAPPPARRRMQTARPGDVAFVSVAVWNGGDSLPSLVTGGTTLAAAVAWPGADPGAVPLDESEVFCSVGSELRGDVCVACAPHTVGRQLADGSSACVTCHDGMTCEGENHLSFHTGYWHEPQSVNLRHLPTLHLCRPYPAACCPSGDCPVLTATGDLAFSPAAGVDAIFTNTTAVQEALEVQQCAEGHGGLLCAECDPGYSPRQGRCVVCDGPDVGLLIGAELLVLAVTVFYVMRPAKRRADITLLIDYVQLIAVVQAVTPGTVMESIKADTSVLFLSLNGLSSDTCTMHMSPEAAALSGLFIPLALLVHVVLVTAVLAARLWWRQWRTRRNAQHYRLSGTTPRGAVVPMPLLRPPTPDDGAEDASSHVRSRSAFEVGGHAPVAVGGGHRRLSAGAALPHAVAGDSKAVPAVASLPPLTTTAPVVAAAEGKRQPPPSPGTQVSWAESPVSPSRGSERDGAAVVAPAPAAHPVAVPASAAMAASPPVPRPSAGSVASAGSDASVGAAKARVQRSWHSRFAVARFMASLGVLSHVRSVLEAHPVDILTRALWRVLLLSYVTITETALSLLNCRSVAGERVMEMEPALWCDSSTGWPLLVVLVALPLLLLVTVGVPLAQLVVGFRGSAWCCRRLSSPAVGAVSPTPVVPIMLAGARAAAGDVPMSAPITASPSSPSAGSHHHGLSAAFTGCAASAQRVLAAEMRAIRSGLRRWYMAAFVLRRAVFSVVSVAFASDLVGRQVVLFLAAMLALCLHVGAMPYLSAVDNQLGSVLAGFLAVAAGLEVYRVGQVEDEVVAGVAHPHTTTAVKLASWTVFLLMLAPALYVVVKYSRAALHMAKRRAQRNPGAAVVGAGVAGVAGAEAMGAGLLPL